LVHLYSVAGLTLASEIPLPGLSSPALPGEAAVTIRLGDVPDHIPEATKTGPNWMLGESRLLLSIPGLASFLLIDGKEIRMRLAVGRRAEEASPFLRQNLLGLLMQQGGRIVLRASSVAVDGKALLFCGGPAVGKSTLAAAMAKRGHGLLGDDFCTIERGEDGVAVIHGDNVGSLLWADAIDALGLHGAAGEAVREGIQKYEIRPVALAGGLPLAAVYHLIEDPRLEAPRLDAFHGIKAVQALREAAYRLQALATTDQRLRFFQSTAAVAGRAPLLRLSRPTGFEWIDAGTKFIEAQWDSAAEKKAAP
jgi:hypothetical protein